jgi:HSP20 family molecular chaperone IbpA
MTLSNQLANARGAALLERVTPWTPLRELLGYDPFQNVRSAYGFDYEVSRTEAGYEVEVPVPGYSASQIDVTFKDGIISVGGKTERRSFTRSFTVPDDVNPDSIAAKVQDGLLTISLLRHPEAQPRKISVN